MAYKCDHCHKGKEHGHMVSHAKNRLARLFLPNLQKLKVLQNGITIRVKFCTSCIKRLKKDGRIGAFRVIKLASVVDVEESVKSVMKTLEKETKVKKDKEVKEKVKAKEQKARETLDIASIVGKKN